MSDCQYHEVCGKDAQYDGLCYTHSSRKRRGQDPLRPLRISRAVGTGTVTKDGYVRLHMPDHPNASKHGQVFEHVVVMADSLGRPLKEHENVHHKNGNRSDNRIDNLELWSTWQPKGQRVEDLLAWAHEITKEYNE